MKSSQLPYTYLQGQQLGRKSISSAQEDPIPFAPESTQDLSPTVFDNLFD